MTLAETEDPMSKHAPHAAALRQAQLVQAIELQTRGADAEAIVAFRRLLATNPNDQISLYSLGALLMKSGDRNGALAMLEHGVRVAPGFAPLWFARGTVLQGLDRKVEALASYDEAIKLKPDYVDALLNSGVVLREMQQHGQALLRFNKVLESEPNHESALGNCGILLTEFKQSDKAVAMFERLLRINPDYAYGPGLLCYERLHACDWTGLHANARAIVEGVRAGRRATKTLGLMAISGRASDHFLAARIFAHHWFPKVHAPLWRGERYGHARLRIAYVSPDLREHPVSHLMAGVFEGHDKSRFETWAISLGRDDGSRLRQRIHASFDHFIEAGGVPSQQIAQTMREAEIDVAIDLAGYTSDSRLDIFAHRPAPVQVTYLGYPGTLGTNFFDYILADRHVIPPEHQPFYSEKVAYLPDTYLPTDGSLQPSERTPTRAECGLPETGAVLCSFSHDYKLHPDIFDVWMRMLRRTPGSVLWLVQRNAFSQANLRREAAARGVDPARLVFAERVPRVEDHLARYRLADIFLDTAPYNAHTTAADALMAGLPVITWMGEAFPSRVAGSLLHAVGLPELATRSLAEYEALALKLLGDPALLAQTKAKLAANRKTHPLFDTARFCRNVEAACLAMVAEKLGSAV